MAALEKIDGNCGIEVEPLRMGRISANVDLEGEDIPSRGGALLESDLWRKSNGGRAKQTLQRFLAHVESDLQRLSLLFCFSCCEFPRNQPFQLSTERCLQSLTHDFFWIRHFVLFALLLSNICIE